MKDKCNVIIIFFLGLLFSACPSEDNSGNNSELGTPTATVIFINHTSYDVDVYKNFNPEHFDPVTLVCTVNSGDTRETFTKQYPSYDQVIGDTFYPHYKIPLADILKPGITKNIDIDAQRLMTNLTFVIESGKRSYNKSIPQPNKGELSFFHGYIEIQNQGSSQIHITRGGSPLYRLDNNSRYINPGEIGFLEIEFPSYLSTVTMSQLRAFGNNSYDFPTFTAERGKLYRFIFKDDNTVVWNDQGNEQPIKNLDPLSN